MAKDRHQTPEERAAKRVEEATTLMWHAVTYVIMNVFLWIVVPQAAWIVMLVWGLGLAVHIVAFFLGGDGPDDRRYPTYLAEDHKHDPQAPPA